MNDKKSIFDNTDILLALQGKFKEAFKYIEYENNQFRKEVFKQIEGGK
jgi:hypothetical protein